MRSMDSKGDPHANNDFDIFSLGHTIRFTSYNSLNLCHYIPYGVNSTIWHEANSWTFSVAFTSNLGTLILLIRFIYIFFEFVRQPSFAAELTAVIIFGSSVLEKNEWIKLNLRPVESVEVTEAIVNLAIVFHMFLIGLEMDFANLTSFDNKTLCNTAAGILLPLAAGAGLHFLFESYSGFEENPSGRIFWAIALSVTSFHDLARILSDLKLLYTDIGRTALTSAFLSDLVCWALLGLTATLFNSKSVLLLIPTVAFLLFSWFAVRPFLAWALERASPEGGNYTDAHIYFILSGCLTFAFITDVCGSYSLVGAYFFGLIVPKGEIVKKITDKLEGFLVGILVPAFLLVIGFRANVDYLEGVDVALMIGIILLAALPKILSTLIISMSYGIGFREGIALGALMNTKGLTAVIILSIGRDANGLGNRTFPLMVFALLWMMLLVKPISYFLCKSTKRFKPHKHRTLEESKPDSQLRVLMCYHAHRNPSGMINLLNFSNTNMQSPIFVFAVNLVELTRRSTNMLIVHDTPVSRSQRSINYPDADMGNHMMSALNSNENRGQRLSFEEITVVSPYATMHMDLCGLAQDERASLILVLFHKEGGEDDLKQTESSSFRLVNQNLLLESPCSVGIFIDRGLASTIYNLESRHERCQLRVAVLFTGGPDSREALSYASRMIGASWSLSLTVVQFLPGKEAENELGQGGYDELLGDEFVNAFRFRTMCEKSVTCVEMLANSGYEILTIIGSTLRDCDLYILGKGTDMIPQFASGLSEWAECEELGPLGDALSTSDFANNASILVIQQNPF